MKLSQYPGSHTNSLLASQLWGGFFCVSVSAGLSAAQEQKIAPGPAQQHRKVMAQPLFLSHLTPSCVRTQKNLFEQIHLWVCSAGSSSKVNVLLSGNFGK